MFNRLGWVLGVSVAALLAVSSVAVAGPTMQPYSPKLDGWVKKMHVRYPTVTIPVVWNVGPCPTANACVVRLKGDNTKITMYLWTKASREVFYHELGHVFDYLKLTNADRTEFKRLSNDKRDWSTEYNAPEERFAEIFAYCNISFDRETVDWYGFGETYNFTPGPKTYNRMCKFLQKVANR
jgi:hypothetical protein